GWDHAFDRFERAALTSDFDLDPVVERSLTRSSSHGYLVHIDQMFAQRLNIDLRPVRGGIGLQDSHDLLDRAKNFLSGHGRYGGFVAAHVLGMIHVSSA